MARRGNRLTDRECKTAQSGMHTDGRGLYLQVKPGVDGYSKSWIYRYVTANKQTWMGLGVFPDVTLARAREKALDARRLRADGH